MTQVNLPRAVLSLVLLAVSAASVGQTRAPGLPPVAISAQANRDPVEKSYRKMIRGMDLFERERALAPAAPLRFKLLPRHRDTDMRNIRLDVVGDTVETRVPIAADDTFVLMRDRRAFEEDAQVVPNRKARSMTWRTEIRTPGLPPQTRRLGDLRLECRVGMEAGLFSNRRNLLDRIFGALVDTPDMCSRTDPLYLFFSDQPLFSVTLVDGQRREFLPLGRLYAGASNDPEMNLVLPYCDCEVLLDRSFFLPLGDRSWPDDTLVEFEPMAVGAAPGATATGSVAAGNAVGALVPGLSTRTELIAMLPRARMLRFDSGYEVWSEPVEPDSKEAAGPERVVLVDPAGVVAKVRVGLPYAGRR